MNCILLSAIFGSYINCKNMHGMSKIKMVINIWVPWYMEHFFTSWRNISFSSTTLLHGVS